MIIRKIRSLLKRFINKYYSIKSFIKISILEENVSFGKNINLGKNIKIKTTDNGKIIIKENVSIEDHVQIYAQNSQIIIDENTFIGYGTQIVAKKSITIGKDCLIASYCVIRDANHGLSKEFKINKQKDIIESIKIEEDVWLGTHVTVTKGTNIKKGTVVGANSVVTKEFPSYSIIAGVPAKLIKDRV